MTPDPDPRRAEFVACMRAQFPEKSERDIGDRYDELQRNRLNRRFLKTTNRWESKEEIAQTKAMIDDFTRNFFKQAGAPTRPTLPRRVLNAVSAAWRWVRVSP